MSTPVPPFTGTIPLPSTPSPTATSGASSASDSNNQNQNDTGSGNNATLYLYTFLATLVLLLVVSSAIVIRSLILRRRHQRLVEEAIRTGTWIPNRLNSSTGRRRRVIGQKPKLWEAYLHPTDDDGEQEPNEKSNWDDVMPFYAAYVNPPTSPQGAPVGSTENPAESSSRSPLFIRPFNRRRSSVSQPTTASPNVAQLPTITSSPAANAVRVAVLIAMPAPSSQHHDDESGPPVVEIGLTEADINSDATGPSTRDGS